MTRTRRRVRVLYGTKEVQRAGCSRGRYPNCGSYGHGGELERGEVAVRRVCLSDWAILSKREMVKFLSKDTLSVYE